MNEKFPQASLSNSRFTIHGWNRTGLELSHGTDSSASSGGDSDHGTELRRGGGHRVYLRTYKPAFTNTIKFNTEPVSDAIPVTEYVSVGGIEFKVIFRFVSPRWLRAGYRRVSDGRVFSIKEFGQFELEQRRERIADEQRKLDEQLDIARWEREEFRQLFEQQQDVVLSDEFGKLNEFLKREGWQPVSIFDLKRK